MYTTLNARPSEILNEVFFREGVFKHRIIALDEVFSEELVELRNVLHPVNYLFEKGVPEFMVDCHGKLESGIPFPESLTGRPTSPLEVVFHLPDGDIILNVVPDSLWTNGDFYSFPKDGSPFVLTNFRRVVGIIFNPNIDVKSMR